MSFIPQEIENFKSQINISPNIFSNVILSLNKPLINNTSVRIYYILKENDEIFPNNKYENQNKY